MPLDREELEDCVGDGMSIRAIASELGCTPRTVQKWLKRYGLTTVRGGSRLVRSRCARKAGLQEVEQDCPRHGPTTYVSRADGAFRCRKCASESVSRRRRRVKEILVEEAGGHCACCGYGRYIGALQFHHLDPDSKRFSLATGGVSRSLAVARAEAAKCVLLCANCHAEIEAGVRTLDPGLDPRERADPG